MVNTLHARIEFSYKGEVYCPSAIIDLDAMMRQGGELGDIRAFLAREHGIDPYSYLFEVMQSHEVEYDQPTGLAVECLHDGVFDIAMFQERWRAKQELDLLANIADQYLNISDLDKHSDVRQALQAAYRAGKA